MIIPCFLYFLCLLSVRCEIEETLERLKQLERELGCKEQELAERERRLTEWENRLMERSRSCTPVSPHHSVPKITTHSATTLLHTVCVLHSTLLLLQYYITSRFDATSGPSPLWSVSFLHYLWYQTEL